MTSRKIRRRALLDRRRAEKRKRGSAAAPTPSADEARETFTATIGGVVFTVLDAIPVSVGGEGPATLRVIWIPAERDLFGLVSIGDEPRGTVPFPLALVGSLAARFDDPSDLPSLGTPLPGSEPDRIAELRGAPNVRLLRFSPDASRRFSRALLAGLALASRDEPSTPTADA